MVLPLLLFDLGLRLQLPAEIARLPPACLLDKVDLNMGASALQLSECFRRLASVRPYLITPFVLFSTRLLNCARLMYKPGTKYMKKLGPLLKHYIKLINEHDGSVEQLDGRVRPTYDHPVIAVLDINLLHRLCTLHWE